ncbi:hypothetical protein L1049_017479 [Liquidambar formosana]|uniref:Uncharacterized protein n=1 Tax=Liquidambar formosana TaxID=63359 RepID=A0AAP0S0V5_LIQFO
MYIHTHTYTIEEEKAERLLMLDCKLWICVLTFLIMKEMVVSDNHIPTTLEGPFEPVTVQFDPSLRRGSDDLPMNHTRLKKNVTSIFPEQISLAISSPTSMWVSWVTGDAQIGLNITPVDPSTVASNVWYGKESGKYSSMQKGVSAVYSQLYPFEGLLNYTFWHHSPCQA